MSGGGKDLGDQVALIAMNEMPNASTDRRADQPSEESTSSNEGGIHPEWIHSMDGLGCVYLLGSKIRPAAIEA